MRKIVAGLLISLDGVIEDLPRRTSPGECWLAALCWWLLPEIGQPLAGDGGLRGLKGANRRQSGG